MAPTATHAWRLLSSLWILVGRVVCHFPFISQIVRCTTDGLSCILLFSYGVRWKHVHTWLNLLLFWSIWWFVQKFTCRNFTAPFLHPSSSCGAQVRIIRAHVDSGRSFGRQAPGSLEENKAAGAFLFECVIDFFFFSFYLHMACHFSSLIWPAGSAPAALARLLFDLRSPKSLKKHSESRLSYLFAHLHLLASHSFSSLIFSLLFFSSLTLPTSASPSLHTVGNLTSKLPPMKRSIKRLLSKWMSVGKEPSHNMMQ